MNCTPDLDSIVRELRRPEIEKVILFGSHAIGTAHPDSDIDLMVVTTHDTIPQSFRERMDLFNLVYEYLKKIAMNTPIDLIVYSKKMFQELIDSQNMFSKEIMHKGIVLYEKFN
jgi:predicted nucleotidyltransferase